jgi:hypothetical protein
MYFNCGSIIVILYLWAGSDTSVTYNPQCIHPPYFTSLMMTTRLVETYRRSLCIQTNFNTQVCILVVLLLHICD